MLREKKRFFLDELEQRQLFCKRDQMVTLVFSPVRKAGESWTERLQWLLMKDGFGFCSPLSRDEAPVRWISCRLHGAGGGGASGQCDGLEQPQRGVTVMSTGNVHQKFLIYKLTTIKLSTG
ncbi:TPA: hypothetical protein G5T75_004886 [Salmonella enterica]|uniref:Uncharacterized protein n=1 Tax=Salmonella enterica TaxID=28901 RepID=A0A754E913_SALER|nr:hypothetical protein [Salmonella enterica]ECU9164127.1 hypothetical protein [Salmonella enterica subsp. enterica serovar Newport str. CFSAN000599]EDU1196828.1 hypothetical protein [Salmonella enterica subsp. enterica serovar Heidelberg str. CFSAN000576]HAF8580904.1 hypothetical protein [Salmonella enterica]